MYYDDDVPFFTSYKDRLYYELEKREQNGEIIRIENRVYDPEKLIKRQDIQQILQMPEEQFNEWHAQRKGAANKLLYLYKTASSVPFLVSEEETIELQRFNIHYDGRTLSTMGDTPTKKIENTLERALENLELIKNLRERKVK